MSRAAEPQLDQRGRLVNAFVMAQCHQQATLEKSDEECTAEYDSDSSETTLAD